MTLALAQVVISLTLILTYQIYYEAASHHGPAETGETSYFSSFIPVNIYSALDFLPEFLILN